MVQSSGMPFFHIWTSKSGPDLVCFVHFDLQMCFSLQRRAIFPHPNFKKWSENVVFCTFRLENLLCATAACNFSFLLYRGTSGPAALPSLLFDPVDPQIIEKTQRLAACLTFRACWSSFLLSSDSTSLLCFSSSDPAALLCFFNCPYCRKLDF